MILKIRFRNSWWLYDNLRKVRYGHGLDTLLHSSDNKYRWAGEDPEVDTHEEVVPFAELSDICFSRSRKEGQPGGEPFFPRWAIARDCDNDELLFVFDEGYLLNDDGATIERIR